MDGKIARSKLVKNASAAPPARNQSFQIHLKVTESERKESRGKMVKDRGDAVARQGENKRETKR